MPKRKSLIVKFNKSVDSGPLNSDMTPDMQQTVQDERIRRQNVSHISPPRNKIARKKMY